MRSLGRVLNNLEGWTIMGMMQEFKEFAMKGNVLDLAVGVIMGAAFAPIVSTLVDNIVMPPIGYMMAGVDFSSLAVAIPTPTEPVMIKYGLFLNALIKFLITAFAIFLLVKAVNSMKKPAADAAPAAPPAQEVLLKEIRDLLAKR
jgi:large conductance mechanosensitive channel